MKKSIKGGLMVAASLLIGATPNASPQLHLSSLHKRAEVDERYQSYNVEMVEVTGGRFWAPYGGPADERYRQRPPLDLTNPRLIAFAKNLGPAYMRVSGTWSNNTYIPAADEQITAPPAGFKQVLSRQQWRDVAQFSRAVDAPLVTSFAVSTGTRGADGVWQSQQAQRLVDLTRDVGGTLVAAEFFNEPNMPGAAQPMPDAYTAANYGADFRVFRDWARKAVPQMKILGPGGVGEGGLMKTAPVSAMGPAISTADMMAANPGSVDAVSYHFYGSVSQRCTGLHIGTANKADALSPAWLDGTLVDHAFYAGLRDKYEPGKPMWNTETGQAACGGSPWASTFLDTFRYLNQLGALAQKGVQVVMHNTLATSDYALLDRDTMTARPNYWAAVLWRRVMGRVVLDAPQSPSPQLRLYAQCLRGVSGGVGLLALNTGTAPQTLRIKGQSQVWVMTGATPDAREIAINGQAPAMNASGALTGLAPVSRQDRVLVAGQAVAFIADRHAENPVCR